MYFFVRKVLSWLPIPNLLFVDSFSESLLFLGAGQNLKQFQPQPFSGGVGQTTVPWSIVTQFLGQVPERPLLPLFPWVENTQELIFCWETCARWLEFHEKHNSHASQNGGAPSFGVAASKSNVGQSQGKPLSEFLLSSSLLVCYLSQLSNKLTTTEGCLVQAKCDNRQKLTFFLVVLHHLITLKGYSRLWVLIKIVL